ncbi:hypothetical protein ACPXCO_23860 [Streptomyces cyaneofuscatus]|uniref:hypothetical protein n=1 Tax=Streptomyces cyaneofuscatus TaxID=66883 RepID=UPI003CF390BD
MTLSWWGAISASRISFVTTRHDGLTIAEKSQRALVERDQERESLGEQPGGSADGGLGGVVVGTGPPVSVG